ncbi:MAG: diguanylate cyclase domain-containing protein [Desulfopila sp.]
MKNTLLILAKDKRHHSHYQKIFADTGYETIVFSAGEPIAPAAAGDVFAVVVPDCTADPAADIALLQLPVPLPVLLLGPQPQPPPFVGGNLSDHLYDYLGGEVSAPAVTERLHFLHKVARICCGHHPSPEQSGHRLWHRDRDNLTGLFNAHHFNRLVTEHFTTALANDQELSLLLLDLDSFYELHTSCDRSFNDFILRELTARITDCTRDKDFCFRLFGGEFAVLMPATPLDVAEDMAAQLRRHCQDTPFIQNASQRQITLSIGIASLSANQPTSVDELVDMAEGALYKAKAEGCNQVCSYTPADGSSPPGDRESFDNVKLAIKRLFEKTRNATISSLRLLARDIAGPCHQEHLDRVAIYLELLCIRLGLTTPIIRALQSAATLHICLRCLVHNDLLAKNEKFSQHETKLLRDFPYKLSEIIEIFDYFSQERLILVTRNEKFDGSGYPDGLKGDEIPLGTRIISVTDAFAAMQVTRPHRPRLTGEEILRELHNEAGKQFDPFLVQKLLDIIAEHGLLEISCEQLIALRTTLRATLATKEK